MRGALVLFAALSVAALAGCNSPFQPPSGADVRPASISEPVYTGSPASVVSVHGTVKNVGTATAFQVTVTASVNGHSISQMTDPPVLAPGQVASWSAKLAGDKLPTVSVSWE